MSPDQWTPEEYAALQDLDDELTLLESGIELDLYRQRVLVEFSQEALQLRREDL